MKKIILNHKMNFLSNNAFDYIEVLKKIKTENEVIICPSFLYLEKFSKTNFKLGAQNVFSKEEGSYTGEVSAKQLASLKVNYAIIGHSERRKYFHEESGIIYEKIKVCLNNNITPILCIGETLDQKESGKTEIFLKQELDECLKEIDPSKVIIAYEPIWAIGSGKVITLDTLIVILKFLREYLLTKTNNYVNIIYGGSVDKTNIKDLLNIDLLDGVLVGGASTRVEELEQLL